MSDSSGPSYWPRSLLVILALGLAARLALWAGAGGLAPRIDDELSYVAIATSLTERGEFADVPGRPTSIRPPLYPAFVAAVYTLAGVGDFQAVRLAQVFLSLGTCVLVYRLGRLAISHRAGLWAAGLACFYPSLLGYNNLILTEVLFIFWQTAGVLAVATALRRDSLAALLAAGVLLGLGALTRSILWPFAPVLALFLFAAWRGSALRRGAAVLAFTVPFAAVIAPWAARNTRLHHTPVPVDCMGGRNLMMGNYEHTPLYRSWDAIGIGGDRAWIAVLHEHHPDGWENKTQGQIDKLAMAEGLGYVREHPGQTAQRSLVKFFDFWGLERELVAGAQRGFFGEIPPAAVIGLAGVICGGYVLVLFAGALGVAGRRPADLRVHLLLMMPVAFTCAIHTLVFGHSRYHLPVMPLVMVYAGALAAWPPGRADLRRPAFWLAVAFLTAVAAGWAWNAGAGDLDKASTLLGT